MRRMLSMLKVQVLQTLRDRGELVSILVLPIALTWVFGVAFGSDIYTQPVVVEWIQGDSGTYAEEIRSIASAEASIDIQDATEAEASDKLDSGEAGVAVRIPEGFSDDLEAGKPVSIEIIVPPDSQSGQAAAEIVQGAIARVSANAEAARVAWDAMVQVAAYSPTIVDLQTGQPRPIPQPDIALPAERFGAFYETADSYWKPDPPVAVTGVQVVESVERGDAVMAASNVQYSIGFSLMFVMFVSFGSAQGILEEREQGTLRRLLVTPTSKPVILGGKSLGIVGVGAIEALILVGLGAVAFGVPWGSEPLAVLMLVGSYVLAAGGLALLVTAIVRTRSQLSAAGPVIATALAMLGGCYWPIEITSPTMQTIAKFTPTGWGMAGLLDVVARNQGFEAAVLAFGNPTRDGCRVLRVRTRVPQDRLTRRPVPHSA